MRSYVSPESYVWPSTSVMATVKFSQMSCAESVGDGVGVSVVVGVSLAVAVKVGVHDGGKVRTGVTGVEVRMVRTGLCVAMVRICASEEDDGV